MLGGRWFVCCKVPDRGVSAARHSYPRNNFGLECALMPNAQLTIGTRESAAGGPKIVTLGGSLTLETVASFNQSLREEPAPALILDMSELTWLDSAGVGALVQLLVRRSKTEHSLALAGLSPRNNAVLQVAQVLKLFSVYPTVDEAAAKLAQNPNAAQRSA